VGVALAGIEELEVSIEKLVAGGDGLARHGGVPLFVPRTAPGDRARVRIVERRPDFGRAEVVELLSPGPGRRLPPCPHFADCGGCDLQHLDDLTQLRLKVEAAVETLRRLGRLELPPPAEVLAGAPFGYRLRAQLHTERLGDGVAVGYHARGSRRLVPIRVCPILDPALEGEAVTLARRLGAEAPARVDLALGDGGAIDSAPPVPGLHPPALARRVGAFVYAFDARCFFQGHAGLLPALVDRVVGAERGEVAIDLYGGVGLFALPLARRYRRVVLVEGDRIATRYARRNAREAGLGNLEVVPFAVESWIETGLPLDADRVVVDPPRGGLAVPVRRAFLLRPPRRITYVSCHTAALARDLAALSGLYEIESLRFVDLFPQTGHLETLVELARRPTVGPAEEPGS
jgi:tRNA/tmRNA/rRNA uracil-C5-methylase (TrmA/RlmC/RlmD family)